MEESKTFTTDDALRSIVVASPIDKDRWKAAIEHGASDDEIRSTLTFAVGRVGMRSSSKSGICGLATKPKLRFWFGSYGTSGKPTLEGQELVDRIRQVLNIPPASEEVETNGKPEGTMQVLSETLGEEIVESFLPDDAPELVQIEKAATPEDVDSLDQVPQDEHNRTWSSLTYADLIRWASDAQKYAATLGRYVPRIRDEIQRRRIGTWVKAVSGRVTRATLVNQGFTDGQIDDVIGRGIIEIRDGDFLWYLSGAEDPTVPEHIHDGDEQDALASVAVDPEPSGEALAPAEPEQLSFSFDYSELDENVADVVRKCTEEIRERLGSIKKQTYEIAERLWTVKQNLENGQWSRWVQAETGLSVDTADRLVQVAQILERYPQIAESAESFDKSALYLLAAPSTPEAARQEAAGRAEAGETISHERAKEIVRTHKPATVTRERTTRTETTVKEKQTEASGEEFPRGECRVCGCTEVKPCVRSEDGETCSWHQKVINGETVVDDTICHPCARNLSGWVHPTRQGSAKPATQSAAPATSSSKDWIERELAKDPWNKATIDITFHLFPWDGNVEGRLVQVTVKANDLAPKLLFKRYNELYGHPDKGLCLPPPAAALIDELEAELAKAPTPKTETPPKPLIKLAAKAAAAKKNPPKKKPPSKSAQQAASKKPIKSVSKTKSKSKGAKKK